MILKVSTFLMRCTNKEQAVKVLEEAAEAFGAWQRYHGTLDLAAKGAADFDAAEEARLELGDEIADVIQAACNLAARHGIDMAAAMERCEQRNRDRGRL